MVWRAQPKWRHQGTSLAQYGSRPLTNQRSFRMTNPATVRSCSGERAPLPAVDGRSCTQLITRRRARQAIFSDTLHRTIKRPQLHAHQSPPRPDSRLVPLTAMLSSRLLSSRITSTVARPAFASARFSSPRFFHATRPAMTVHVVKT